MPSRTIRNDLHPNEDERENGRMERRETQTTSVVYRATNKKTGKSYIGKARSYLKLVNGKYSRFGGKGRFKRHWTNAHGKPTSKSYNDCPIFYEALRASDIGDWWITILDVGSHDDATGMENKLILEHGTAMLNKGYNTFVGRTGPVDKKTSAKFKARKAAANTTRAAGGVLRRVEGRAALPLNVYRRPKGFIVQVKVNGVAVAFSYLAGNDSDEKLWKASIAAKVAQDLVEQANGTKITTDQFKAMAKPKLAAAIRAAGPYRRAAVADTSTDDEDSSDEESNVDQESSVDEDEDSDSDIEDDLGCRPPDDSSYDSDEFYEPDPSMNVRSRFQIDSDIDDIETLASESESSGADSHFMRRFLKPQGKKFVQISVSEDDNEDSSSDLDDLFSGTMDAPATRVKTEKAPVVAKTSSKTVTTSKTVSQSKSVTTSKTRTERKPATSKSGSKSAAHRKSSKKKTATKTKSKSKPKQKSKSKQAVAEC
ncbi:Hypothetical protein MVR_LOCUS210 [uncultured virus]|nr:Hypothetical protein MVR_LOCUS210 [uncultured virus]